MQEKAPLPQSFTSSRNEPRRLHVLVSYAYWNDPAALRKLDQFPPEWNIMLDSGAFTTFTKGLQPTPVQEYEAFCRDNLHRFWRIINLDRIGDPATSARNFKYLRDQGLPIVPVLQRGEDPAMLALWGEQGFPVCVGGISQNTTTTAERQYLASIMRIAKAAGVRTHLLGVGGVELFRQPCWSGDSSAWVNVPRYGCMRLWDGTGLTTIVAQSRASKTPSYIKPRLDRTSLLRRYDLTWADLAVHENWMARLDSKCFIAGARSYIRLARELSRIDRRYIFALGEGQADVLRAAWELEKHSWA